MARTLLLLAAAVWIPAVAAAQTTPSTLTLDDALELARQHNPMLRRAYNDQRANEAGTLQAWGSMLPRLAANTSFSLGTSTTVTGQDEFGRPVALDEPSTFQRSGSTQGVQANVTIFDGGAMLRRVAAARAQERAGDANIHAEQRQLEAVVTRAFYEALRAERVVALEQELLASARANLERTEELLRIAATHQPDVLSARVQVAQAEQEVARAAGNAEKVKLALLEVMGAGEAANFELAGALPAPFDPATLDVEALVAAARQQSPTVLRAEALARAAAARTAMSKGERWPTITASGSFGRSMDLRSHDAFLDFNPQNRSRSFTLTGSIPIFTGFQTTQQVTQARVQELNAREDARIAALAAAREVRSAFVDLETAHRTLELAEHRAELARERQEMAEEEYGLGALTFMQLQQHIDQAASAERNALEARHAFATALVTLEEKTATSLRR